MLLSSRKKRQALKRHRAVNNCQGLSYENWEGKIVLEITSLLTDRHKTAKTAYRISKRAAHNKHS